MTPWLRRSQIASRLSRRHREKSLFRNCRSIINFGQMWRQFFYLHFSEMTPLNDLSQLGAPLSTARVVSLQFEASKSLGTSDNWDLCCSSSSGRRHNWTQFRLAGENFQLLFSFTALKIPFLKAPRDLIPVFKRFAFPHYSALGFRSTEAENNFKIPNSRSAMIASQTINLGFTPDSRLAAFTSEFLFTSYDRTQFSKNVSCFFDFSAKKDQNILQSPEPHSTFTLFLLFLPKIFRFDSICSSFERFFLKRKLFSAKIRNNKLSATPAFNGGSHCTRISQHSTMTIRQSTNCVVLITAEAVTARVLSLSFTILLLRRLFFLLFLEKQENH